MYPPVPAGLSRGKHVARLTLKSRVAGGGSGCAAVITTLTGLLFILPILMGFVPVSWHPDAIGRWLPSAAGFQIIEKTAQPLMFSPWVGLSVLAGWVAVAFAAAPVLLRHRDA
jgi:ABC-type transport system involved in cytochrome c biogenesis permease subunit